MALNEASAYIITASTTTPTAGVGDQLTIKLVGTDGKTVTNFSGNLTLTFSGLGNAPGGNVPTVAGVNLGTGTTITFTNGVSAGTLVAYKAEGPVTLNATDGTISTTSTGGAGVSLTVGPASANKLVFTTSPAGATAGSAFGTQPVVQTEDVYGNLSAVGLGSTVPVTIAIKTGSGTLQGTTSYDIGTAHGDGTITGSGLRIDQAGSFTLSATASGLTEGDSSSFTVSPAATASAYRITDAASGSPTAGVGDQLTIKLVDQFGNTETGFNGDKTLTFSGLSTADDGTHPTVTDKTGAAVNEGTSEAITFASGVSSAGGVLTAYKAETKTLNVSDSGGLSSTSTGGAGDSLTIANANPTATDVAVTRTAGTRLLIALSSLTNHWSDANHDVVKLQYVITNTPGWAALATNSSFILCPSNAPNVNDTITYGITDGHGGTGTGHINITINPFVLGQTNSITGSPSSVTVKFYGIPSYTYIVQRASSVSGPWSDFATNLDSSGPFTVTDNSPPNPAFYRLKWQP